MTALPPKDVLEKTLHKAIIRARAALESNMTE
jgi:hypothetical protein